MKGYGKELILDLKKANTKKFNRRSVNKFFKELCKLIDMNKQDVYFWDDRGVPKHLKQTKPETKGVSAVCFILTSTIVIHTLELRKEIYINIFSCKDFDHIEAALFSSDFFEAKLLKPRIDYERHIMNCVFIIPTGINCSIGGHAGDASPFFNMIAGMCDTIITNPNTLNASDICEIPKNCMYVEGSILDDFLDGNISFKKKNNHRVLVLVENRDKVSINIAVNTAQAAMCNLGIDIVDVRLFKPIFMKGWVHEKRAWGDIRNLNNILDICYKDTDKYDCVAITSYINRQDSLKEKYNKSRGEIPNPWGAVEAMLSKELSVKLGKMVVHSPMYEEDNGYYYRS